MRPATPPVCDLQRAPQQFSRTRQRQSFCPCAPPLVRRPGKPINAVKRGSLIALGEGGVIEHRIDKVVQCTAEGHDGLPDVQQFAGALAYDMHSQKMPRLAMKNNLQTAGGIAPDLPAGNLAIICDAHFVRHIFVGELLLGLADKRDLRDRINPVRIVAGIGDQVLVAEGARNGDSALLHRYRGQTGEANHVSHGEDVRHLGAEVFVYRDAAARIRLDANGAQVQLFYIAGAADRIEQRAAGNSLLAFKVRDYAAIGQLFYAFHFLVQTHGHAAVAQVVAEGFHNFLVGKLQQLGPLFDQGDAHAERGEHAGVLHADDTAAYHDERLGQVRQFEDLIAVDDGTPVDGYPGRVCRLGAGGYDDVLRLVGLRPALVGHLHVVGIFKTGHTGKHVDPVSRKLRLGHIDFGLDHMLDAEGEIRHRDLFLDLVIHAVDLPVVVAGKMHHGFAHGFAGDGPRIDGNTTDGPHTLNDSGPLAQFIGVDSGALPRRAGTNDE